jgi:uncharacterized membrane protein
MPEPPATAPRLYRRDRIVRLLFRIGVIVKGIDGALEMLGAVVLFYVPPALIPKVAHALLLHELSEDPQDFLAGVLSRSLQHFSVDTQLFGVVFLLGHGAIKLGLVVALLGRHRWAYPVAIAAFTTFVGYQLYRFAHTHSPWLILLSAIDIAVIGLTWLEYRRLERAKAFDGNGTPNGAVM